MSELKVEADPADVGLDADRLERIGRHFRAYVAAHGSRDLEAGTPVETDTVWRIYSMTKPITSVAAMMLYEEGGFGLTDPVSPFIPSFAGVRVYAGGSDLRQVTVPATEPVRGRLRTRPGRRPRPRARQGAVFRGRAVLGRRGQYHVLDRPGRRADRLVLHP